MPLSVFEVVDPFYFSFSHYSDGEFGWFEFSPQEKGIVARRSSIVDWVVDCACDGNEVFLVDADESMIHGGLIVNEDQRAIYLSEIEHLWIDSKVEGHDCIIILSKKDGQYNPDSFSDKLGWLERDTSYLHNELLKNVFALKHTKH